MATIKVACPKCGQKVSGDESFYGTTVECPVCSADIFFAPPETTATKQEIPEPVKPRPEPVSESGESLPAAGSEIPGGYQSWDEPPALEPVEEPTNESNETVIPLNHDDEEEEEVPSPVFGAISMVSSVLGVVTCVGGMLFSPLAIVFGHAALAKSRRSPVQPAPGQTLGAIGMMIGYIWLGITILVLLVAVLFKAQIGELLNQASMWQWGGGYLSEQ